MHAKISRTVLFAIFATGVAHPIHSAQRPITPEEIVDLRWVAVQSLSLSPDGKQVAYTLVEWDKTGDTAKRKRTLWLVATDGSNKPRNIAPKHHTVSNRQWSPDGKLVAFLSEHSVKKKNGKKQVWVIGADGSNAKQITQIAGAVADYAWSPDGKSIAFTAVEPGKKKVKNAPIEVGKHPKNEQLRIINLSNKKVHKLSDGNSHIADFTWSPAGDELAVSVAPSSDPDDLFDKIKLVIISALTGKVVRTLAERVMDDHKLAWSPDGRQIVFPQFAPKHIARRLAVIPARGGDVRYPLKDFVATPMWTVLWGRDSRHLWLQMFERTRNRLIRLNIETGKIERLANAVQNFWNVSVSSDSRTFVLNAETGKKPPEIFVFRKGEPPRQLTHTNPHVEKWNLGEVKEVQWKSKCDGMLITGVLVTPPGFEKGEPVPTIVELHGGPQGMWWSGWLGTYVSRGQFFASRGYATFLPNPRGSIGMGVKFVEANYQDWGGKDVEDILDGVDYLVKQKIADPKRLAVGGLSYGGFLTAMLTSKSNRFRAAVVDAGITDLVNWNLTSDISGPGRIYMGGDEFTRRDVFRRCSPFTYIQNCKTPTLVLHGEKDARVPLMQGRLWHRALKHLGVETEMVVYPGAGHVLSEREHMLDSMRRVMDWYERYLR